MIEVSIQNNWQSVEIIIIIIKLLIVLPVHIMTTLNYL